MRRSKFLLFALPIFFAAPSEWTANESPLQLPPVEIRVTAPETGKSTIARWLQKIKERVPVHRSRLIEFAGQLDEMDNF